MEEVDAFSTDLRAATLLGRALGVDEPVFQPPPDLIGRYLELRQQAGAEMLAFIEQHIQSRRSFAFETTVRDATFDQAARATANGFRVHMIFVAGGDVQEHIERVADRGRQGGHIASEPKLREIYQRGMQALPRAFEANQRRTLELLSVYHNPRVPEDRAARAELVVQMTRGVPTRLGHAAPPWFHEAVRGTPYAWERLRARARGDERER